MTTPPGETFAGFTPSPDCIREDLDVIAANVFGAVWRFSQQARGQCDASLAKIARRSGYGTTVTRQRLRSLAAHGWIIEEERQGKPTVYRDAGRWVLQVIGDDTLTPTRGVAPCSEPQRVALPTPTLDVGLPQRVALAEDSLLKKDSKSVAPNESAPPPVDAWAPVKDAISTMFGGLPTTSKNGQPKACVGQTLGVLGRAAGDDPDRALVILAKFAGSKDRGFCNRMSSLPEAVGSWLGKHPDIGAIAAELPTGGAANLNGSARYAFRTDAGRLAMKSVAALRAEGLAPETAEQFDRGTWTAEMIAAAAAIEGMYQ